MVDEALQSSKSITARYNSFCGHSVNVSLPLCHVQDLDSPAAHVCQKSST